MAAEVGAAFVTILPSARGFQRNLERSIGGQVAAAGATAGSSFGRSFSSRASAGVRSFTSSAGSAIRSFTTSAASSIRSFASSAFASLKRVGIAAGIAAGAAGAIGLKMAASLQTAQIGFTTLLGSAKAASAFLTDVRNFAVATPFDVEGLIGNARALLGVGTQAKNVLPTLQALGDATAALGLNQDQFNGILRAYTQIASKGKVQAEELLQIAENGVPAVQLFAKALGLTVPQLQALTKSGQLTADVALPALLAQLNKDYGGSMGRQFNTLTGLFNNFKETTKLALSDGLQPLVPILQRVLPQATNAVGAGIRAASSALAGFIRGFQGAQFDDGKVSFFEQFGAAAQRAFNAIRRGVQAALPFLASLWTFITTQLVPAFVDAAQRVFPQIKATFGDIANVIRENQGTFKALGTILTQIVLPAVAEIARLIYKVLGPAFTVLVVALRNVVIPAFVGLAKAWLTTVDVIVSAAAHAFGWVHGIGGKLKAANRSFDQFAAGVNASLDSITRDLFVTVHVQTSTTPSDIAGGVDGRILSPQQAASANRLGQIAKRTEDNAKKAADSAKNNVTDIFKGLGGDMTTALADGVGGGAGKVAKAAKDTVNKAAEAAKQALQQARDDLTSFAQEIRDGLRSFGDLTTISSATGAAATPNSLKFFLQRQLAAIKTFGANLARLRQRGISDALITKIANAGIEAGGPVAAALAKADKATFGEIQSLDSRISRQSVSIGQATAQVALGDEVRRHQATVEHLLGRIAAKKHLEVSGKLTLEGGSTPKTVRTAKLAGTF